MPRAPQRRTGNRGKILQAANVRARQDYYDALLLLHEQCSRLRAPIPVVLGGLIDDFLALPKSGQEDHIRRWSHSDNSGG